MSVDSAARLKEDSATFAAIGGRRPRARVAIGVLAALVYFAILAFAGVFISGAVSSMGDRGAVARAVVQQITGDAHDSTSDAQSPPPTAAQPESPRAAVDPVPSRAAPAPPQPARPESPRASVAATAANRTSRTTVAALTPATELPRVGAAAPAAPAPKPSVPAAAAPKAVPQQADTAEVRALVQSGDARRASGDIASARLYYERAAEAGDARAARLLANSYDPAFLERWGVFGMTGNAQEAARWYRLASGLGDREAARDLASLQKQ